MTRTGKERLREERRDKERRGGGSSEGHRQARVLNQTKGQLRCQARTSGGGNHPLQRGGADWKPIYCGSFSNFASWARKSSWMRKKATVCEVEVKTGAGTWFSVKSTWRSCVCPPEDSAIPVQQKSVSQSIHKHTLCL